MIRPVLDPSIVTAAALSGDGLVAELMWHISALDRHIDDAESAALELSRVASLQPIPASRPGLWPAGAVAPVGWSA